MQDPGAQVRQNEEGQHEPQVGVEQLPGAAQELPGLQTALGTDQSQQSTQSTQSVPQSLAAARTCCEQVLGAQKVRMLLPQRLPGEDIALAA